MITEYLSKQYLEYENPNYAYGFEVQNISPSKPFFFFSTPLATLFIPHHHMKQLNNMQLIENITSIKPK